VQLAIEIDGITHQEEKAGWKDEKRQKELEQMIGCTAGYK
jgi:very-short-patch-repair endonuclease